MLIGVLTYIIYPVLLTIRDLLLWWIVEKLILNKELRRMITIRASANWYLQNKYKLKRKLTLGSEGAKYYLEGLEVSQEEHQENEKAIDFPAQLLGYFKCAYRKKKVTF